MNDHELKSLLATYKIPPSDAHLQARAEERALIAFRNAPTSGTSAECPEPHSTVFRFRWALALLLATTAILFLARTQRENFPAQPPLLSELEILFPGHLAGVVTHNGQVDIILTPESQVRPGDQRVTVELHDGRENIHIQTYSGNELCIPLDEGKLCITPLLTGKGEVLLLNESGLMDDSSQWRISARQIDG